MHLTFARLKCLCLQGAQPFSNYGYKSNEELILGYGFILDNNPADFVNISLGLGATSADGKYMIIKSEVCTAA